MHRRRFLHLAAVSAPLAACSPLSVLNTLTPVDDGGRAVARGLAYGPDPRHRLDVYAPHAGGGPLPVVLFIYGGGWNNGSRDDYDFVGRAFAAQGFVAVIADYRLVPAVRFPAFVEDTAAAVRWVRDNIANHGGRPDRLFLAGHSAGAYNVVMTTLDARYLAAAGVDRAIVRGVVGLAGPYDFLPLAYPATIEAFGLAPDLKATQPVELVSAGCPPMFLATGADDDLVFPRNTRALAARLRAAGGDVAEKVYPDLGHSGILLALGVPFRDRAPVLADIVGFLRARS